MLRQAAPNATVDQMLGALQSTGVPITDTRSGTPVTRPRIRVDLALDQLAPPAVTWTAVMPNNGKVGFAAPVTITGTGFVAGATVNAGAGITVSNVVFVSPTQLTATFRIDGAATLGTRNVRVTLPTGEMATLSQAFTVNPAVTVTLAFNGKLRDKVGGGDTARTGDGALDGTLTMTMSATGGRTVTALRLSNGIGGVWDTVSPNGSWLLGVATSLDGPLLNDVTTMAVNTMVADGGSLRLFASDYGGGLGFATGGTLTIVATLADGTSVQASTRVTSTAPTVSAVTPNQGTSGTAVPVTIDGTTFVNGATVSAGTGIMVGNVAVVSSTRLTATFTIAADATGGRRPPDAVRVGLPRGHGIRVGPDPDGHRHVLRRHLGGGDGRHSIAGFTDTRTAGPASDTAPV